jgi:hypothetical protein
MGATWPFPLDARSAHSSPLNNLTQVCDDAASRLVPRHLTTTKQRIENNK